MEFSAATMRSAFALVSLLLFTTALAGPEWAKEGAVRRIEISGPITGPFRTVSQRKDLDVLARAFAASRRVDGRCGAGWTFRLEIDAPGAGSWRYDPGADELISAKGHLVYRLKPADALVFELQVHGFTGPVPVIPAGSLAARKDCDLVPPRPPEGIPEPSSCKEPVLRLDCGTRLHCEDGPKGVVCTEVGEPCEPIDVVCE